MGINKKGDSNFDLEAALVEKPNDPLILKDLGRKYENQAKQIFPDREFKPSELTKEQKQAILSKVDKSIHFYKLSLENNNKASKNDLTRMIQIRKAILGIPTHKMNWFPLSFLLFLIAFSSFFIPHQIDDSQKSNFYLKLYTGDGSSNSNEKKVDFDEKKREFNHFVYFEINTAQKQIKSSLQNAYNKISQNYQNDTTVNTHALVKNEDGFFEKKMTLGKKTNKEQSLFYQDSKPYFLMPNDNTFKTLTIIRSALYNYVLKNGSFPENLQRLTMPFPNNFLSFIPVEPISNLNMVSDNYDGSGGWVYSPPTINEDVGDLKELIKGALTPNTNHLCKDSCDFFPLEITINKPNHSLTLKSANVTLFNAVVGLGKENSTPEGNFFIQKRVVNPNHHLPSSTKPFGTRGMELSNQKYAIHGTYDNSSIGQNVSKGCIRLTNADVESLFAMTPLYTQVSISSEADSTVVNSDSNTPLPSEKEGETGEIIQEKNKDKSFIPFPPTTNKGSGAENGESNDAQRESDTQTTYHWAS